MAEVLLGIETSCDETAAAVVTGDLEVRSNTVLSQIADHRPFGGVVPEVASRCHVEAMVPVLEQALETAGADWGAIDRIAVTRGPGLASSLLVGLSAARALALRLGRPVVGVNHLHGHLYSLFLGDQAPAFGAHASILVLLVSGGHTALVRLEASGAIRLLGQTLDDAAGEALDKASSLLGLGYPGGPAIEQAAAGGDPGSLSLPGPPRLKASRFSGGLDPDLCFSFSGLKTALLYHLKREPAATDEARAHGAAAFQQAVVDVLLDRLVRALDKAGPFEAIACVGGVARNRLLRSRLDDLAASRGVPLLLTEPAYCTDNAAMIAAAALLRPSPSSGPLDNLDAMPGLAVDA